VHVGTRLADLLRGFLYAVLVLILAPVTFVLFRLRASGTEHLKGGGVLIARHRSYWDIILLGVACGPFRRINFLARNTLLKHPLFAPVVWGLATVIDREAFSRDDYRRALASAHRAPLLGVFPEGTTKGLVPPKAGALRFAHRLNRPLIPVNLAARGPYPPRYPFRFPRIQVRIGRPIAVRDLEKDLPPDLPRPERFRLMADRLMEIADHV